MLPSSGSPPLAAGISVLPVTGMTEVRAGMDLPALVASAIGPTSLQPVRDGDIVCISSKIVSKALGLVIPPHEKAQALDRATVRTIARRKHGSVTTSVVETVSGPVLAAAGIDASNAPDGLLTLPEDPDHEAENLLTALRRTLGVSLGVILTDTSSRVWRMGVTDLALGAAGVCTLEDHRGRLDDEGRPLRVTVRALGDEIAAAADLVKNASGGIPLAIVRGLGQYVDPHPEDLHLSKKSPGARALNRTGDDNWFPRPSLESVWQALGLTLDAEPIAAMSPEPDAERLQRAVTVALTPRRDELTDPVMQPQVVINEVAAPAVPLAASPETAASPATAPCPGGSATAYDVSVIPTHPSPTGWMGAATVAERLRTAIAAEDMTRPLPAVAIAIRCETDSLSSRDDTIRAQTARAPSTPTDHTPGQP